MDKTETLLAVSIRDAGTNYRKKDGILLPKSFFVIVSGGEKTERLYFKIISNQDKFVKIRIEFIADSKRLNPKGLLETAKYKQEHYKTCQENEADKVYIVSDVDDFIPELLKIKLECDALNFINHQQFML
ncbi:MAG: RloB family protein [Tannerella sp.]|nr:RloB family protein [Tannerella sp.]